MSTATFALLALLAQSEDASLKDPGFESATLDPAWERVVYGAPAQFELDAAIHHGGARSLKISASEPSDAALGQELTLKPLAWYRFRGFVKTQQLDPMGAPTCGTFQVQHPHGAGVLAAGPSHRGDSDWNEVVLPFETPTDGRVRIAIFLVGFGKGTGSAWFDDLSLEPFDPGSAPIRITKTPLIAAANGRAPPKISPLQYGQFVEFLCDLVPGMWAERLCDGGFEGLSPYQFEYLRETDFKEHPWVPCGATNRAEFAADHEIKVAGDSSKRIRVEGDTPCTVGVEQRGVYVEAGKPCTFHCWLRREGPELMSEAQRKVRVRVHRDRVECASCDFNPTSEWSDYTGRVSSTITETDATLSIEFGGPGTLWIDNASLMPFENESGWRPDVVKALHDLNPGVIRFGGTALEVPSFGDFEWRNVIGPVVKRRPLRAWGGLQPLGAGLEEFVQLCKLVDAEPLICVRFTDRTPKDAADEIEYFNGSIDTPLGKLRAANGHAEPYHIKYWQVGNEMSGPDYEAKLLDFCKAMKAADPTIELLSAHPTVGVVANAGSLLDYVCPHDYGCADLIGKQQQFDAIRALLRDHAPGRDIHVAVTEWNTTAGDVGPHRAMLWTLENALACARYHNLLHRNCDLVTIANRSNLTNSFCSGILQTDNHRLYVTPTYWTQYLYANFAGTRPLKIESELPTDQAPDFSATLSDDGRVLTLFAVNDTVQSITRTLDLTEFSPIETSVQALADSDAKGEPDATNSFEHRTRVAIKCDRLKETRNRFDYAFPPLSLTVLTLTTSGRR